MNQLNLIQEVIKAIETGEKIEDSRGTVYKQQFGQAFLDELKRSLVEELKQTSSSAAKYLSIKEFREKGFLQEANRLFFHPLGLALEVNINDDDPRHPEESLGGIWDYREDPEGMLFGEDMMDNEKARNIEQLRMSKLQARIATGECYENGIQKIK